jgi:hypothetical protein
MFGPAFRVTANAVAALFPVLEDAANTGPVAPATAEALPSIAVTAKRLNDARGGIQMHTSASTHTIDAAAQAAIPGGDATLHNQVIMRAANVAQDSFGEFHIRGADIGRHYLLHRIILTEGISVFGESWDLRLSASMSRFTGALPAEYGSRTAGIIDLKTCAERPSGERDDVTGLKDGFV